MGFQKFDDVLKSAIEKHVVKYQNLKGSSRFEKVIDSFNEKNIGEEVITESYEHMVFVSKDQEEEWNKQPEHMKKYAIAIAKEAALKIQLDMMMEKRNRDLHENRCKYGSAPI